MYKRSIFVLAALGSACREFTVSALTRFSWSNVEQRKRTYSFLLEKRKRTYWFLAEGETACALRGYEGAVALYLEMHLDTLLANQDAFLSQD